MRRTGRREDLTGANPTDRGKAGSKLHLAGERGGLPLALIVSAADASDATMLEALLEDIPPIRMPTSRRRRRPREGACRQGLRSPPLPAVSAAAGHQAADRRPQD